MIEIADITKEEVIRLSELLRDLDPTSGEYAQVAHRYDELAKILLATEKQIAEKAHNKNEEAIKATEANWDRERKDRELELQKEKELREASDKKKERGWMVLKLVGEVLVGCIPAVVGYLLGQESLYFEETGSHRSTVGKSIYGRLNLKK